MGRGRLEGREGERRVVVYSSRGKRGGEEVVWGWGIGFHYLRTGIMKRERGGGVKNMMILIPGIVHSL